MPGKKQWTQEEREFFKKWAKKHKKEYKTLVHEEEALEKLLLRKLLIEKHNRDHDAGKTSYRRGYNQHSDLSDEERSKGLTGLRIPESEKTRKTRDADRTFPPGPASVNWTAQGIVGDVEDQSKLSSKIQKAN